MIRLGERLENELFTPRFIYTIWPMACQEQAGFPPVLTEIFLVRQSAFIHNAQLAIDLRPVADGCSPSFGGFESRQIQCFQQRRIARKNASLLVQPPIGGI